ncbi:MAG: ABC transporter substrate-binding protein [Chloroflexota bacterium]
MNKKILWLVVSSMMVLSLVMAACAPAATPTTPTTPVQEPSQKESVRRGAGVPQYGGTLTSALPAGFTNFDLMKGTDISMIWVQATHNEPIGGDFTKGPQGSRETDWNWGAIGVPSLLNGELAESWDLPDSTTIIWHLRKGVRFAKNPKAEKNSLVNGREMVADDWVWSIEQAFNNPLNWQGRQYRSGDPRRPTSFKALDKYTVEVKVPATAQALMLFEIGGNNHIKAPELWTTNGDNTKWENIIGTGPWILADYVDGSQSTFVKNPDYWGTDPNKPGNKVPYLDKFQILIIPDIATKLTALRTGKIDFLGSLTPANDVLRDDAKQLLSQYKDLKSRRRIATQAVLIGREDKPPFNDIKVRRALNLAVDKKGYLKDYLKDDGAMVGYPYPPGPDWAPYRTELEQLPADVQELYTGYNPEKARQLLKEAGYPNGFKAEVVVTSTQPSPDEVSLLASYLSKVGVTLDIKVTEPAEFSKINTANSFKDMIYGGGGGIWAPYEQLNVKPPTAKSIVTDPYFAEVGTIIGRDWIKNTPNYIKTMKESGVKELATAYGIWMPVPYKYTMWWPWLHNYEGIGWTGWADVYDWTAFLWIDRDLKKSLGF